MFLPMVTPLKTPILFLIFNRPDMTHRVFKEIRKAKPQTLFIAADGPRERVPADKTKCEEARNIIGQIDWSCSVKTLFREKNQGCKDAVSSAISWFFENVEEGIILEDDCLPSQSFFWFCEELLERYREDSRILMVSGLNVLDEWKCDKQDYHFSTGGIWGWATWERAWRLYDGDMKLWNNGETRKKLRKMIYHPNAYGTLMDWFEKAYRKEFDTWDVPWAFARMANGGLSINPCRKLISNIGFGPGATHTTSVQQELSNQPVYEMTFPLRYNNNVSIDVEYQRIFDKICYPKASRPSQLRKRIMHLIKRVKNAAAQKTVKIFY
jgi:hypothetical protein